jgi:hypothetical protein
MSESTPIVYAVVDWEKQIIKGIYPQRHSAADAAFCQHSDYDEVGTQTTIVSTEFISDATPSLDREEILKKELEASIPPENTTIQQDPDGGEPL